MAVWLVWLTWCEALSFHWGYWQCGYGSLDGEADTPAVRIALIGDPQITDAYSYGQSGLLLKAVEVRPQRLPRRRGSLCARVGGSTFAICTCARRLRSSCGTADRTCSSFSATSLMAAAKSSTWTRALRCHRSR